MEQRDSLRNPHIMALNPDSATVGNQPAPVGHHGMPAGEPQMRQLDFYQAMRDFKAVSGLHLLSLA